MKKIDIQNNVFKWIILFACFSCFIATTQLCAPRQVDAIGDSGSNPPASGQCRSGKNTWCGQSAVSWRWHSSSDNTDQDAKNKCTSLGIDGYYLLAYEVIDIQGGRITKYHNYQITENKGKHYGVQVNQLKSIYFGGGTSYNYTLVGNDAWSTGGSISGTKTHDEVRAAWNSADKSNFDVKEWSKVSWFCSKNPSTPPPTPTPTPEPEVEGWVSAQSVISVPANQNGFVIDDNANKTSDWDKDITVEAYTRSLTFDATISHNLKYAYNDLHGKSNYPNSSTKFSKNEDLSGSTSWDFNLGVNKQLDNQLSTPHTFSFDANRAREEQEQSFCQTIYYSADHYKGQNNGGVTLSEGKGKSQACIKVHYMPPEEIHQSDIEGEFWSTSSVTIGDNETSQGIGKQTSDKNGKVTVELSTDSPTLDVTFSHNMYYTDNLAKIDDTTFNTCTSNGFPKIAYTKGLSEKEDLSQFCTNKSTSSSGTEVKSVPLTIGGGTDSNGPIAEGSTREVCHKITYSPQKFNIKQTEHLIWVGNSLVQYGYSYSDPTGSGQEDSEVCVKVTRPNSTGDDDPDPDNPGPTSTGSGDSSVMFAGETASIGWKAKATAHATRRVVQLRPVSFLVKDDVNFPGTDGLKGSSGSSNQLDPCAWHSTNLRTSTSYHSETPTSFCSNLSLTNSVKAGYTDDDGKIAEKRQQTGWGDETIGEEYRIVVPDGVGYKYCNSVGFKWEYWWGLQQEGKDPVWKHVDNKDYWVDYNAICRTIAKKPLTAIWNGSIFSQAQIAAKLAQRANTGPGNYNMDGTVMDDESVTRSTFGSWIEHSLISNADIKSFASGAGLARGRSGLLDSFTDSLNMLSIANNNVVSGTKTYSGKAGINSNATLLTRLEAYLKNQKDTTIIDGSTMPAVSGTGTKIYRTKSADPLNITNDIILNDGGYSNIYQIPQVIIFADGDVNISGNVSRLDAWIIAPKGTINTCSDLNDQSGTATYNASYFNEVCEKQLTINGPIIAKNLKLNRTYGADGYSYGYNYGRGSVENYTPAEIFNLSGASYLWAYAQSGRYASSYSEAYSRELAPRY